MVGSELRDVLGGDDLLRDVDHAFDRFAVRHGACRRDGGLADGHGVLGDRRRHAPCLDRFEGRVGSVGRDDGLELIRASSLLDRRDGSKPISSLAGGAAGHAGAHTRQNRLRLGRGQDPWAWWRRRLLDRASPLPSRLRDVVQERLERRR
jgi:hypothetical protein